MRDEKKVLELRLKNYSQRKIASVLHLSRNTVKKIFEEADKKELFWDRACDMSEDDVHDVLFPKTESIKVEILRS